MRGELLALLKQHSVIGSWPCGAALDLGIVAWLVFWFSKQVLREETVAQQ
jgi:hypothetical protein